MLIVKWGSSLWYFEWRDWGDWKDWERL